MTRIVRGLIVAHVVTVALVIGTLLYGVFVIVPGLREDRVNARHDTCTLIVGLAKAATRPSPRQEAAAKAFIDRTPLRDCNHYAQGVR